MHDDLRAAVDALFPELQYQLENLVRIPSVSAPGFDAANVRASAEATAGLLRDVGLDGVRLLEIDGAHPAVFGEVAGPAGAPTVLLYAHHDVQPPGPAGQWDTDPFRPVIRDGRMYGRGTSDDKSGVFVHLGALRAFAGSPPVAVKVFVEGEEEIGSLHLAGFLDAYRDLLAADVIVIADSSNLNAGHPCLTTSLRGLVDCYVEVSTLRAGVHSGEFGGAVPDALTTLIRALATLHDDRGEVAVGGLTAGDYAGAGVSEAELRERAGMLPGVGLIGTGHITSRLWTKPALSVLAVDSPPVAEAINQLVPMARAKVSMRLAPGQDTAAAMDALVEHLRAAVPWGARVTVTPGTSGAAFALDTTAAAYDAWREGFRAAWGTDTTEIGVGGSIPFVAAFNEAYPSASVLLTGVADERSRAHGPNESLHLDDFRKGTFAEAVALRILGG